MSYAYGPRLKIKINELDNSSLLSGFYNQADPSGKYVPLYCKASDGSDSLNLVVDINSEDIYVLLY